MPPARLRTYSGRIRPRGMRSVCWRLRFNGGWEQMRHTDLIDKYLFKYGLLVKRLRNLDDVKFYRELYGGEAVRKRQFYNIGAGIFKHQAWTNIDHYSERYKQNYVHLDVDLENFESLPIEDESAYVVYSSHTVEHISMNAVERMLKETYRILRPGGFFRVTTPNATLFWNSFVENDKYLWRYLFRDQSYSEKRSVKEMLIDYFASQIALDDTLMKKVMKDPKSEGRMEDVLDFFTSFCTIETQALHPEGHMNWWSTSKMAKLLEKVGFEEVYESYYGQSRCPVMKNTTYFDTTHPYISLFVEARKK
jgi:predicted SAM-dependent methyltransferase